MIGISETWKDQRQLWEPHLGDEDKDEGRRGGMRAASSQGLSALRSPLQIKKLRKFYHPLISFIGILSILSPSCHTRDLWHVPDLE